MEAIRNALLWVRGGQNDGALLPDALLLRCLLSSAVGLHPTARGPEDGYTSHGAPRPSLSLARLSLVCRHWRRLVRDDEAWRVACVTLFHTFHSIPPGGLWVGCLALKKGEEAVYRGHAAVTVAAVTSHGSEEESYTVTGRHNDSDCAPFTRETDAASLCPHFPWRRLCAALCAALQQQQQQTGRAAANALPYAHFVLPRSFHPRSRYTDAQLDAFDAEIAAQKASLHASLAAALRAKPTASASASVSAGVGAALFALRANWAESNEVATARAVGKYRASRGASAAQQRERRGRGAYAAQPHPTASFGVGAAPMIARLQREAAEREVAAVAARVAAARVTERAVDAALSSLFAPPSQAAPDRRRVAPPPAQQPTAAAVAAWGATLSRLAVDLSALQVRLDALPRGCSSGGGGAAAAAGGAAAQAGPPGGGARAAAAAQIAASLERVAQLAAAVRGLKDAAAAVLAAQRHL